MTYNKTELTVWSIMAVAILLHCSCTSEPIPSVTWKNYFNDLGTFSSARCADLNGDGTLDIVIGAGKDQMTGTSVFTDLNEDGVVDVIIGGRAAQLKALDGRDGSSIWEYEIISHEFKAEGYMRFNFFTPQILQDLDGDDVNDLLVSNGGNIAARNKSGASRFPGVLAILSGANGSLISIDTMPDGQETYMSPALYTDQGIDYIIFGTGGETVGGRLYQTTLDQVSAGDISEAKELVAREGHGFIAPPVITDVNADGHLDIIANWHGGEMLAVDGHDHQVLWSVSLAGTELNTMPTPGEVTGDGRPDFFTTFSMGAWPKSTGSIHAIVDGSDGRIIYQDTLGCVGFSSGLSYDLNQDGYSEFIYSTNEHNCDGIYLGQTEYHLRMLDFYNDSSAEWYPSLKAKNISSTPWLGDMDRDGRLEFVICIQANYNDIFSYYGLQLNRLDLNYSVHDGGSWTQYMGGDNNCVF